MNERIRKLAEQANGPNPFFGTLKNQMTLLGDDAVEKFAELIVRECMMLVEGFEITQEVALDEYVDYEASAVLKEHFGVKE